MLSKVIVSWAALGVALTGATQLRLAGLPLGPGEAVLTLWIAFFAFCLLRGRVSYSDAFRPFVLYWAISAVLLSAGSIAAIALDELDAETAAHDALALGFVGVLSCLLSIRVGNTPPDKYYLNLARVTFFMISASGLVLLAAALVTSRLGPISLWYHDIRLRGWSENPNQLALFMVPMPFLGWYLLQRARGFGRKLAHLAAILVCTAVGLAAGSDALRVTWAAAAGAIAAWLWIRLIVRGQGSFVHIAVSYFLVPLVVIALAVGARTEIAEYAGVVVQRIYEKDFSQGDTRIAAWLNGIDAIGHSPLVGLGPGAYSGIHRPFEGFEAHNTFIDWGMSTGLLGVVLLFWLLSWCVWRALRTGAVALLGVALAVIIESQFHYSLRQPVYWLLLLLVMNLTEHRASARMPRVAPSGTELLKGAARH